MSWDLTIISFGDFITTPMVYEGLEKVNYEDFANITLTDEERKIVNEEYEKQSKILSKEWKMKEKLDNWFSYHAPGEVDTIRYEAIRKAARAFAQVIVDNTPESADQTAALRKIREAVMTANAAIACGGK